MDAMPHMPHAQNHVPWLPGTSAATSPEHAWGNNLCSTACRPEVGRALQQQNLRSLRALVMDEGEGETEQTLASCGWGPLLLRDWLADLATEREVCCPAVRSYGHGTMPHELLTCRYACVAAEQ